jgi:ribosomal protein S18 acetylase RimI-like enzyme
MEASAHIFHRRGISFFVTIVMQRGHQAGKHRASKRRTTRAGFSALMDEDISEQISYRADRVIGVNEFKSVLDRSGLATRRPIHDVQRLEKMLSGYTFVGTAWRANTLVGIATVWTDWAFSAYLADLAVDRDFQGRGIGRRLIRLSKETVGPQVTIMLLSAPSAVAYYAKIGMERFSDCFLISRSE